VQILSANDTIQFNDKELGYNSATRHFVWLVRSPGTVYHCTFVRHLHYQRPKTCSRHLLSRSFFTDWLFRRVWAANIAVTAPYKSPSPISISIYFVQTQVGLHSQKTNEQDNQAHNMLSQLPAATDRKVKQQYNWKKITYKNKLGLITNLNSKKLCEIDLFNSALKNCKLSFYYYYTHTHTHSTCVLLSANLICKQYCGIQRRLWLCQCGIGRRYDCGRWVS